MRKSLGDKRNEIGDEQIDEITRLYGEFAEGEHCKIFANEDFGYRKITVERPLRLNFQASPERHRAARRSEKALRRSRSETQERGGRRCCAAMPGEPTARSGRRSRRR